MKKPIKISNVLVALFLSCAIAGCTPPPSNETTGAKAPQSLLAKDLPAVKEANAQQPTPTASRAESVAKLSPGEESTISVFEKLSPSVVYVTNLAVRRDRFSMDITSMPQGTGSGFVWDNKGTIITNFHVINGAQGVQVTLADGSVWDAQPVGFEPDKDLAVIRIDAPSNQLHPIPIGRSESLKVGQSVLAIGNPFGLDHTLTTGVISGLDREIQSMTGRPITGAIQTDAAINPGNSGGPLLDSSGNLIGINTAIYSPSGAYAGIGFAIPVDTVKRIVPEILAYGKITKPGLGIQIASPNISSRLDVDGVLVLGVAPGGPADKIGIHQTMRDNRSGRIILGDILVRLGKKRLKTPNDLYAAIDEYKVGDSVEIEFLRDGQVQTRQIVLERIN